MCGFFRMKIQSNIFKLYLREFFAESLFFIPIFVPFLGGLGFSMQQILVLEAVFAAMLVLFEIPSGYFADLHGKKKSIVIGAVLEFIGLLFFVFSNDFTGFLFGEIILGIGTSFQSGANEALLYESLLQMKRKKEYKKIQGNVFFWGRMGATVSKIIGAFLAVILLRLPFYATLLPWFLVVIIAFTLIEPGVHVKRFETWKHFLHICGETFLEQKKLKYLVVYAAIPPAFFLMTFWLYQKYMEAVSLPIFYFGIVIALMNITSGLGSKYAKEIEEKITPKLSIVLIPVVGALVWILLAAISSPFLIVLFMITSFLWGFTLPVVQDYLQNLTGSDKRATVLSIRSFLTRALFLTFAPFFGWITDMYSVQAAFAASSVLLLVFGGFSLLMLKKVHVL